MDMDMTERKRKERQLIIVAVIAAAIFAAGWIFLPILAEKILLGVILVLIVGAMYLDNSTGRYICKRILLALMTVFIIAAITFFTMNAIPGGPFSKEKAPSAAVQAVLAATSAAQPVVAKAETKMTVISERDIPITRPENYKYTPEELAQLKKQAAEAYLKWVELEMEISRNNLQQTAQK